MIEKCEIQVDPSNNDKAVLYLDCGIVNGEPRKQIIPLSTIASMSEQLGSNDVIDTVEMLSTSALKDHPDQRLKTQEGREGEENIYTETATLLTHLEQVREIEAYTLIKRRQLNAELEQAVKCGDVEREMECLGQLEGLPGDDGDPRSPELVGALAYHRELRELSDATSLRESLLAEAQQTLRDRLHVPDPECNLKALRSRGMTCDAERHCKESPGKESSHSTEDRLKVLDALRMCRPTCESDCQLDHLEERRQWISWRREVYCHTITRNAINPCPPSEEPAAAPKPPEVGIEDIVSRYKSPGGGKG